MSDAVAPGQRHLLTVWNPTYASGALDDHLAVLLDWAERYRHGEADDGDRYVWWAKVRSTRRDGALPHLQDILDIQEQIERHGETHLYLTDYRSLYVGELDEITKDDVPRETPSETDHMPAYYSEHRVDVWFRLLDVRRIVADDTVAVIQELQKLRNVRYHDRPVSLYGGMVELPLIVTRADDVAWFRDRDALTGNRLWVEHDAELRSEVDRMGRELRDNLFGPVVWSHLDLATRGFLASAEAVFRARRDDPHFDFSGPALGYAKAVEAELNRLLFEGVRSVLARSAAAERTAYVDGRPLDLARTVAHQPLGTIAHLLRNDDVLRKGVRTAFQHDWKWLEGQLPAQLDPVVALRNPAAHSAAVARDRAAAIREQVLGIGCEGLIVQLARVRMRVS
jgi:hypothetical protein